MQTKRLPYEVLFRFDDAGALVGSPVQWRYVGLDDKSNKIAEASESAKTGAVGGGRWAVGGKEGFPLADILDEVQKAAVVQSEAKTAELATLQDQHAETTRALERAEAT